MLHLAFWKRLQYHNIASCSSTDASSCCPSFDHPYSQAHSPSCHPWLSQDYHAAPSMIPQLFCFRTQSLSWHVRPRHPWCWQKRRTECCRHTKSSVYMQLAPLKNRTWEQAAYTTMNICRTMDWKGTSFNHLEAHHSWSCLDFTAVSCCGCTNTDTDKQAAQLQKDTCTSAFTTPDAVHLSNTKIKRTRSVYQINTLYCRHA